ncbi:hypothetical protein L2E82_32666 [Cichorium intybus]|uniref:Uncharacterized protein n=1 Tax=Cichorium intybus TaxID=13427 RepID=A0ACB9BGI8_CICIN|nr:hypothetical protein L2E82_32666 [Cichorium intybus]
MRLCLSQIPSKSLEARNRFRPLSITIKQATRFPPLSITILSQSASSSQILHKQSLVVLQDLHLVHHEDRERDRGGVGIVFF